MHTDLAAHLCWSLRGGLAHCGVGEAFGGVDWGTQGALAGEFPHSLWQLLEHLRICQRDLIDYSIKERHVSPAFPGGLWPASPAVPTGDAYDVALEQFDADREELCTLISTRDLLAPLPCAPGETKADPDGAPHTLLRTATIALDHQAYHVGQAVAVRRALGCWPG